jgi:DNA-binding beta-propeller fold protein YncE
VSVIDTTTRTVVDTVEVGGNPWAVAITNDNDKADDDETVFVTDFFSRLIEGKSESFDDARQGVVFAFPSGARRR